MSKLNIKEFKHKCINNLLIDMYIYKIYINCDISANIYEYKLNCVGMHFSVLGSRSKWN